MFGKDQIMIPKMQCDLEQLAINGKRIEDEDISDDTSAVQFQLSPTNIGKRNKTANRTRQDSQIKHKI